MSELYGRLSPPTIGSVTIGRAFKYNSNYPTQFIVGDTWYPTWADDGVIYTPCCDTAGWNGTLSSPVTLRNLIVSKLSTFDSSTVGTLVNSMDNFGSEASVGPDGKTFKTGGLISVAGVLYLWIIKFTQPSLGTGWIQIFGSAQLIKSSDHGVTWTPQPPGVNQPYASPMFPGTFGVPSFIQYGQNYQNNFAHNSNVYVYCLASASWNNGADLTLGRVAIANIGNLSAADYSFYTGGNGMLDANWSSNVANAVSLIHSPSALGQTGAQYISQFDSYVMFGWYYPSIKNTNGVTNTTSDVIWNAYVSKTPWGPWSPLQIKSYEWIPQGLYNPIIFPNSVSGNTATAICAGDFNTANDATANGQYTLTLVPLTFNPAAQTAPGTTTTFDPANTGTLVTLSNGNLTATGSTTSTANAGMTRSIRNNSSGKYYIEVKINNLSGRSAFQIGIGVTNALQTLNGNDTTRMGDSINSITAFSNGQIYYNSILSSTTFAGFSTNTVVGIAVDLNAQLIWYTADGVTWNAGGQANPASGIGGVTVSGISGNIYFGVDIRDDTPGNADQVTVNFGASAFSYAVPSGFFNF